jgi:hypothetical protein
MRKGKESRRRKDRDIEMLVDIEVLIYSLKINIVNEKETLY